MGILSRTKREERAREAALAVSGRTASISVSAPSDLTLRPVPVKFEFDLEPLNFDLAACIADNEASAAGFSLARYNAELDEKWHRHRGLIRKRMRQLRELPDGRFYIVRSK